MSQEKVNYKKEQKKNRRSILRKKKIEYTLSMIAVTIVSVAIVGWIGYSVYTKAAAVSAENSEYEYHQVDTDALQNYISGLN